MKQYAQTHPHLFKFDHKWLKPICELIRPIISVANKQRTSQALSNLRVVVV